MHFRPSIRRSRLLGAAGIVAVTAGTVLVTATPAIANAVLTISPPNGPAGGGNTITLTTPTTTPTFTMANPIVLFQQVGVTAVPTTQVAAAPATASATCWPSYYTGSAPVASPTVTTLPGVIPATSVTKFSANKLYVKVPNLPIIGPAPTKYNVCVYPGTDPWVSSSVTGSRLIAASATPYQVSPPARIDSRDWRASRP